MTTKTSRQARRRLARLERKEVRQIVHAAGLEWVDWDLETIGDLNQNRAIRAESYRPRLLFDTPVWRHFGKPSYLRSPQGTWAYANHATMGPIPDYDASSTQLHSIFHGGTYSYFSDEVIIPGLVDLWRSHENGATFRKSMPEHERFEQGAVWMSATPAEMISQRSGIRRAKGKVLIGGFGLGWFLEEVCKKDDVEEVVVVDRSEELLDWYGYRLCEEQAKVSAVICSDVYDVVGHFPDHQLLLDIWPTYDGARHDASLAALLKTAGDRVWAWGMD